MKNEEKTVSLDTMTGAGKKMELAGREYIVLPVNICDMHYVIGTGATKEEEEESEERLIILNKKSLENDDDVDWQLFGLNVTDPKKKAIFMKIINKYVFYKDHPMTEELLIEHNWSFKEIGKFLYKWVQISD